MLSDEEGLKLHDRATCGQTLSPGEQEQLQAWYELQDSLEASDLQSSLPQTDVAVLKQQIESTLSQLTITVQRIQQVTLENESIREEIQGLKQQLPPVSAA
jgi:hypothetical protein